MKITQVLKCLLVSTVILVSISAVNAQVAWWEPEMPLIGQEFTIFYDASQGTIPEDSDEIWLHWGVVDGLGNWAAPPEEIWPDGSQLSGDGFACQSPMIEGENSVWSVTINPTDDMDLIEFVFTDMGDNWDNNGNNNWNISFITEETVSWWSPEEPEPGDLVTIYYNLDAGTLPDGTDNVTLHWGMNEQGHGNWQMPPEDMWPEGSIGSPPSAVQSPLNDDGEGVWSIQIQTNDTTYSIHYVLTDGTNWDNNSNANWDILLDEPPPVTDTWHTFYYDTRSRFAIYTVDYIDQIYVAGTFNDWDTDGDAMNGPDENGVYWLDMNIPAITTSYKFVVNGQIWNPDPDNPIDDGSEYGNSLVNLEPREEPTFWHIEPREGTIFEPGDQFFVNGFVRTDDILQNPLEDVVHLNFLGEDYEITYDAESGFFDPTEIDIPPATDEGLYLLTFEISFEGQQEVFQSIHQVGIFDDNTGFHAVDGVADNNGNGDYLLPDTEPADNQDGLLSFHIYEAADGDSIQFEIQLDEDFDNEMSTVLLQINSDFAGIVANPAVVETEMATPEWNGSGVQLILTNPDDEVAVEGVHNVLITQRDPVMTGSEVDVDPDRLVNESIFVFTLSIDELEGILGSYNGEWYFSVCSFFSSDEADGYTFEVNEDYGGIEELFDPDIYDVMFTDTRELQHILVGNYNANRTAALDNIGRGFVSIEPDEIGPNVGSDGPALRFLSRGAPTIRNEWTLTGTIDVDDPVTVTVRQTTDLGEILHEIPGVSDTFNVDITLDPGVNTFRAEATYFDELGISPSIVYELLVEDAPVAVFENRLEGNTVYLDASESYDPDDQDISFQWVADENNPDDVALEDTDQDVAWFTIPETHGEYYFDLVIEDTDENVTNARTLATVYPDSVDVFELDESVHWVRDAIVYEIFVRAYGNDNHLVEIANDMERIYNLGVSTIWLTPINPGPTAHGYEITDYYGIDEDLGSPDDFAYLVEQAHSYGMKVILDMVLNHTSIQHPFMQHATQFGIYSPYYDWYARDPDGDHQYYYDWFSLPNLNFNNPDVWKYFIDMCVWWVEEYDVDGYRCDVAWGPQQRNDQFWVSWRTALKTIKPELFLLGEANGRDWGILEDRFDLGYDWELYHDGFNTIFPGPGGLDALHNLIINEFGGEIFDWPAYKYPFRFIENHDESRFIAGHTADQTRLAATLLFSIPGVPLIYAGQEVGETSQRGVINFDNDPNEMFGHYSRLIQARKNLPALRYGDYQRLTNNQEFFVYSVMRTLEGEYPVISAMNFFSNSTVFTMDIPTDELGLHPDSVYILSEIINDRSWERTGEELQSITTSLNGYHSNVYVIADSVVAWDVGEDYELPLEFSLSQNYPNPFNPDCIISFTLPHYKEVKLEIFNIMGQKVRTLVNNKMNPGHHQVLWNGKDDYGNLIASGVYFYRIESGDFKAARKMVMIK